MLTSSDYYCVPYVSLTTEVRRRLRSGGRRAVPTRLQRLDRVEAAALTRGVRIPGGQLAPVPTGVLAARLSCVDNPLAVRQDRLSNSSIRQVFHTV